MFERIKKHKGLCIIIICIAAFVVVIGVPFGINLLFKIQSNINIFEAEWTAGDALGYYGALLSFIGTVVLGALALYQNHIIKQEADRRALLVEKREHIENMPKFHMQFRSCFGFGNKIEFSISNISENIAYGIRIYDIRIREKETTLWESEKVYNKASLASKNEYKVSTDSPEIKDVDEFSLTACMSCKDKYEQRHDYFLKMSCSKPNKYSCDAVKELF